MQSRFNKAFSLVEVLITVGILSTAITFIFRSFTASLNSAKFSQNITLACYLAESKLFEIEQKQKNSLPPIENEEGSQDLQGKKFNWSYEIEQTEDPNLIKLEFNVSWQEGVREKEYVLSFSTYLLPKK